MAKKKNENEFHIQTLEPSTSFCGILYFNYVVQLSASVSNPQPLNYERSVLAIELEAHEHHISKKILI